ncbi:reverse transcriptase domain-containing protein [Tanacetum coccineum]
MTRIVAWCLGFMKWVSEDPSYVTGGEPKVHLGASFIQGMIPSIPIGGSISLEGFLLPVLLLVVIIVMVGIVIVIFDSVVDEVSLYPPSAFVFRSLLSCIEYAFYYADPLTLGYVVASSQRVPVGPMFLLGLLLLAIDAACAFRAEEMPSLISCWMAAKVMAGVSDVDHLRVYGYIDEAVLCANDGDDNVVEEEDGEWIRFLGNNSSGIKKYRGSNSSDGGNTEVEVKIAGGVIGFGGEIDDTNSVITPFLHIAAEANMGKRKVGASWNEGYEVLFILEITKGAKQASRYDVGHMYHLSTDVGVQSAKFDRFADKQSGRPSGSLPSNTQPNPKDNPNDQQNDFETPINFDSDDEDDEPTPQPKPKTPKPGKFLKELVNNKHKIEQIVAAFLSDESSAILQNKVPPKLGDPGSFLIPCNFNKVFSCNALADLGVSINLVPYSLYAKLSLETLKPTKMSVRLADRSFQYPVRIAENMLVEVGKFTFPADFVILEMEEDSKVPLILGRPFLHTADAVI